MLRRTRCGCAVPARPPIRAHGTGPPPSVAGSGADPSRSVPHLAERPPVRLLLRVSDGLDRARNQRRPRRSSPLSGRRRSSRRHGSRSSAPSGLRCTARSRWRALGHAGTAALAIAYTSLLSAWKDYLAHDNDGRPIIFIGHSQGSAMLIKLLQTQVDPSPSLRTQDGVRHLPRGKRAGPSGPSRRWHLPQHPGLQRTAAQTALRHRLLVFRVTPAGQLPLRPGGARGEPALGRGRRRVPAGGVRQPRHLLPPCGQPAAVSS